MNHIYWLSQIKRSEQSLVGDKLFTISQLLQHGCPMMPGFILDNSWLKKFLQNLDDSASLIGNLPDSSLHLDVDDYRVLQSVAQQSRQIINQANFPQLWQSEIFQAAQQLNSKTLILHPYITIPYKQHRGNRGLWRSQTCFLSPEALCSAIKRIWAELFTAKSLFYWQKLGLTIDQINLAVLIRPLKSVKASGIMEIDADFIHIQATFGLETSLERGEVKPDEYQLNCKTGAILEQQLGQKNYGYRLRSNGEHNLFLDCLEPYLLDFDESESYTLDTDEIAQLIESTKSILQHQPHLKSLKWNLLSTASKAQFYFIDLDYLPSLLNTKKNQPKQLNSVQPLLRGLGASPGTISAEIIIVPNLNADLPEIPSGCILVTKSVPPHQISLLKQIKGIITEQGSMTSHAAIIARELGIPAVVNAVDAMATLQTEQEIFLNGNTGEIYRESDRKYLLSSDSDSSSSITDYATATRLMVNLSQPEAIADAVNLPVDGVGLLRSELMLSDLLTSQSMDEWGQESQQLIFLHTLTNSLRQFASAFAPRPVFYRSIDWYAQESEFNSLVGARGT